MVWFNGQGIRFSTNVARVNGHHRKSNKHDHKPYTFHKNYGKGSMDFNQKHKTPKSLRKKKKEKKSSGQGVAKSA